MDYDKNPVYVDASASGCPGPTEYRGVYCGEEIFSVHLGHTSVNVGEFLAIVHALRIYNGFPPEKRPSAIYSDSQTARAWVKRKMAKTRYRLLAVTEAEKWLKTNTISIPVVQWSTRTRGDIPADYGRKAKSPIKAKNPKYSANFLWGFADGSIEALGYEFANAKTEEYQKECWSALLETIKQSVRDKQWQVSIIDQ